MTPLRRRVRTVALLAATLVACQSSTGPVLSQPAAATPPAAALRALAAASVPTGPRPPAGDAAASEPARAPNDVAAAPGGAGQPVLSPAAAPALGPAPLPPVAAAPAGIALLPDPAARALALAEARMDAGQHREALDLLDGGPLPPEAADLVALRRGELALELGDWARARAELTGAALAQTSNRILLIRAAAALERLGEPARAADLWLRSAAQPTWTIERLLARRNAAIDYARAGRADAAAAQLAALADAGTRGAPVSSGLEAVAELGPHHAGLVALIDGRPAAAAAAFRRYLAEQPGGEYALMAGRRLAALQSPPASDPDGWSAARDQDGAEAYRAWIEAHPDSPRRPEARFRQGLAHYRAGDLSGAIELWSAWIGADTAVEVRARALYWIGKALAELGDGDGAGACWRTAAATRPSTYYAVRAADRLAGAVGWPDGGPALPAADPSAAEEAELQRWLSGWAPPNGPSEAEATALRRAGLFASIGLERTAGGELDGLIDASANPRTVLAAGRLAREHRLWHSAARAGVKLGRLGPAGSGAESPRAVRRLAYPAAYGELVAGEAGRRGVGPLLILSLMRQESLFDRFARSVADARGLTQVMPSTGAGIASARGQAAFSPEELYDPSLSISFGAGYVADQLKYFGGDVFRAVAAYNAGGAAAARWAPGSGDPDLFVEAIAYAETREYLKSIYQYHATYRGLASRSD